MKKNFLNLMASLILLAAFTCIYCYQQLLLFQPEDLYIISGAYKKLSLKTEKRYPAKLYLKNDNNSYVLQRNAYKAWDKHRFLGNIEIGDTLHIGIDKEIANFIKGTKKYRVNIITLSIGKRSYLDIEKYNTFQKAGSFKLYIYCIVVFVAYLFLKSYKFKSSHIYSEDTSE